ncbi:cysteine peptidase family C39 domain-containing protein [Chryseobacterium cheonjiense]|uniref:Peptidase C39 domain-containing protein n=1 Tax=Chryseobacterium cheonjiense TaxID=2728845 RepID=A0A7Y0A904_9FLAO|nr:hypothetical protein [Chryseobacterium cheonjiense]NML58881.1 hypothetical protein [Chryseobacterium cheonjiense]
MIEKQDYLLSFNFLLKKFIKHNKKVRKIKDYTLSFDDYNFFSFYNILQDDFDIESMVIRLDDWEDIEELTFPAIAFLNINGGMFVIISDYKDGKIYWENREFGKQTNTIKLFKRISEGIFLVPA